MNIMGSITFIIKSEKMEKVRKKGDAGVKLQNSFRKNEKRKLGETGHCEK